MKGNLLVVFIYITILCAGLGTPHTARADHGAGGELYYEWISDSTYRFYYKFYRDCAGMSSGDTIGVCYANSCGLGVTGLMKMGLMPRTPDGGFNSQEVNPPCPGYTSTCHGGTFAGFQVNWYSATVTLPYRCNAWSFAVQTNSRNGGNSTQPTFIYNLNMFNYSVGCSNANHEYVEATLDNSRNFSKMTNANSDFSPVCSTSPVFYACINTPYHYNPGAIDPDGDSLAYEMIQPRSQCGYCTPTSGSANGAGPIPFLTGYSYPNNPFATNNTFKLDPLTGEITFTPSMLGYSVISLRINEYRNGVKIGSTMQDMEIITIACTNPPPPFTLIAPSITGGKLVNGTIEVCANEKLNFDYKVTSVNPVSRLIVRDNSVNATSGAIVTYDGEATDSVTGHFSWTPSMLPRAVDSGMRVLIINLKDSICVAPGIPAVGQYAIPIHIKPAASTFRTANICPGGFLQLIPLTTTVVAQPIWSVMPGGSDVSSLSCTSCKNPNAFPKVTTTYLATAALSNGCANADTILLNIDTSASITITPPGPLDYCLPTTIQLHAQALGTKPLTNLSCGPTATVASPVEDTVTLIPFNTAISGTANVASTPFTGSYSTARHQYLLRSADMRAAGMYSGTLKSITFKISYVPTGIIPTIFNNINIGLKCTPLTAVDKNAGFITGATSVYTATTPLSIVKLGRFVRYDNDTTYVTFPFSTLYNWDTTQNLLVDVCYANTDTTAPAYTYFYTRTYESVLYTYAATGSLCNSAATLYTTHELPVMTFDYNLAPEGPFTYAWHNLPTSIPGETDQSLLIDTDRTVYVTTTDRHGCAIADTIQVGIVKHNGRAFGDTSICVGDSATLTVQGGQSYQWYQDSFSTAASLNCTGCEHPVATPTQDVTYEVIVNNGGIGNCNDTFRVAIKVAQRPVVHIENNDTTIVYGTALQLVATGADNYLWTPATSLSNPNISSPIAKPLDAVTYIVMGSSAKYATCRSYDTISIDVDKRGRIMIPDAFTPNGDGKNDVFHVVHMTFQQLLEFRVFNRWGQEVYTTTDPTKGWDGTWKGVPQEIGTYFYLVRVGFPDNTEQTFKGDVTLIR